MASGNYYPAGASVTLTATPTPPLVFTGWSNGATTNSLQFTMSAPMSLTAGFDVPSATCTMTGDATAGVADVQFIVNEGMGTVVANNDLNGDGMVNVVDIQRVIGASLNLSCAY